MRRLKFRAWNAKLKLIGDFTFDDLESGFVNIFTSELGNQEERLDKCKIMQYVGEDCKDKNGKEYCEDDIIKDKKALYVILRRQERFCIQSILSKEIYSFSSFGGFEAFEIVGNIHQNTELLK